MSIATALTIERTPAPSPWRARAACLGRPTTWWYGTTDDITTAVALSVCDTCPVRAECLDDALDIERHGAPALIHGVRGGLDARERRALIGSVDPQ